MNPSEDLIPSHFWLRESTVVARDLIGCTIETHINGSTTSGLIVETEAYPGHDPASHVFGQKRPTKRTSVQYYSGGHLYMYLIMGLHTMTSIVVNKKGVPDVVFIRAIKPIVGIDIMKNRRHYKGQDLRRLGAGPGLLSQSLGLTTHDHGKKINSIDYTTMVYITGDSKNIISAAPRINLGVHGANEKEITESMQKPWRFFLKGSRFLSK